MATSRICSIPDCGNTAHLRGWCGAHYERWRRHGDPLAGRILEGEAFRYFSEVVMAYDGDKCLTWPYWTVNGYGRMVRGGKEFLVHRLLCEEINGPPPLPEYEAAHSCGNGGKACVTKGHLSWKTHAENMADQIEHGTRARGERHGSAKLTEDNVRSIRALRGVLRQTDIAKMFGVSRASVGDIHTGKKWGWL